MSLTSQNYSNAQSSQWVAYFTGLENITFKLKSLPLPNIKSNSTDVGSAASELHLHVPGTTLQYSPIEMVFIIDYDFSNYNTLLTWMKGNIKNPDLRDCTVSLIGNNGKDRDIGFIYKYCFPTNIGKIILESNNDESNLVCTTIITINDFEFSNSLKNYQI